MSYEIDVQVACKNRLAFTKKQLIGWVSLVLQHQNYAKAKLTLRLVEVEEITHLNHTYRQKNKPTNVLAFPSKLPKAIQMAYPFLGDVVICPEVLTIESGEENKTLEAHWAHITIHGVLHLLGYDHVNDEDEKNMQTKEIALLDKLGFANPYYSEDSCCE